jgi:hypothetical protein
MKAPEPISKSYPFASPPSKATPFTKPLKSMLAVSPKAISPSLTCNSTFFCCNAFN